MYQRLPLLTAVLLALLPTATWSATGTVHTVTTTADSGAGSLRNAIMASNLTPDADLISFDASLSGQTIFPLTELPALNDGAIAIDGDLDNDGDPDIALCGSQQASGDGVRISAHADGLGCRLTGLAIFDFPRHGIYINASHNNVVQACHVGVSLAGGALRDNGGSDIYIEGGNKNLIGGDTGAERNVLAGGNGAVSSTAGVYIEDGAGNLVQRNFVGLKRSGKAALGTGGEGVIIDGGIGNTIGGSGAATRNVFGGLKTGVSVAFSAAQNLVAGNYVGATADGSASLPLQYGVIIGYQSHDNTVGGFTPGRRNIFAGGSSCLGVYVLNTGAVNNLICGNYFGLTPNGLGRLDTDDGIHVGSEAGKQTIGGSSSAHGNLFCCDDKGVVLRYGGAGSVIRRNVFGRLGNGSPASGLAGATHITIDDVSAALSENDLCGGATGLLTQGTATPKVTRNAFTACDTAVRITETSVPNLGNLSNAGTADDGANVFALSTTWNICNQTSNYIRAEGNEFGTTSKSAIDATIYDKRDNAILGRVDFVPLLGGVTPTDASATLALTGASAAPTAAGAEIAFTLSAPASVSVEVLNVAGRPVATLAADRPSSAGLQRIVWNGLSAQGLHMPSGRYLVRVTAADAAGRQATALTSVHLNR